MIDLLSHMSVTGWIEASYKIPDDARDVIIRFEDGMIEASHYNGDGFWYSESNCSVTHWCELPTFDSCKT